MARRIFFIGYMGAGKSTTARQLQTLSGLPMVDMDEEVERISGQSVASIFAEAGEAHFRDWENRVLRDLLRTADAAIIACGGGLPCNTDNWDAIEQSGGHVVWLDPPFAEVYQRLKQSSHDRPLAQSAGTVKPESELRHHFEERQTCYAQAHERITGAVDSATLERWSDWLHGR